MLLLFTEAATARARSASASGVLGELTQKFVNYRIRLVVLGDVTEYTEKSEAFRDYVRETNAGDQVWFVADEADFAARLVSA